MRLISPADWLAQPWQNGRGITHEIARWPAETTAQIYDVRVSIAEVTEDGPFSQFPGYRRWTFLAGAAPIQLDAIALVTIGDHVELPGEQPIQATLRAGRTTLVNVIARPGTVVGFGATAHPVRFVMALRDRPGLDAQRARLGEPTRMDTVDCIWIA